MKAQRIKATGEHEFEPVHGLPERLPSGETLLWQGAPDWKALAVQAFHVRKVALYFGALMLWRAWQMGQEGGGPLAVAGALLQPLALATLGLGLLALLAWLSARSTVYTLTDRRVVMRVGIVLTVSFNLPLARIDAAGLQRRGRVGNLTLRLAGPERIAYLHLWPHARPWALSRPEPMLRALADAEPVAQLLAQQLRATQDAQQAQAAAQQPPAPAQPAGKPAAWHGGAAHTASA